MGAAAAAEGCRLCPLSSIELDLGHSPMLLTASSLKDNHMSFKTCACVCVFGCVGQGSARNINTKTSCGAMRSIEFNTYFSGTGSNIHNHVTVIWQRLMTIIIYIELSLQQQF